jgi:predicted RNA methylase
MKTKKKAFSSVDIVHQCLIDEARTNAFRMAIQQTVKPGDIVLDAGTGSGILALMAARAGAKSVIAIELDKYIAEVAKKNIENNGYSKIIKVISEDATNYCFKNKFDVVVIEMMTTGMVDESQVRTMNNLIEQKAVHKQTAIIPKKQKSFIALGKADFTIYDLEMRMVKHLWNNLSENQQIELYSNNYLLHETEFNKESNEEFEGSIIFGIKKSGAINCVYLYTDTYLTDLIKLRDTETFNAPVIVPINNRMVKRGDKIKFNFRYSFGSGYNNFFIE